MQINKFIECYFDSFHVCLDLPLVREDNKKDLIKNSFEKED
jgi:hypothetical protein